jgi:hypothetical protein
LPPVPLFDVVLCDSTQATAIAEITIPQEADIAAPT